MLGLPVRTDPCSRRQEHASVAVTDRSGAWHCYNCVIVDHQTRAQNLAYRMLGDWAAAEDAVQEAFMSGYRAFDKFRGENLTSWLMRIVSNACKDMLRSRRARPTISMDAPLPNADPDLPPPELPSGGESPDDYVVREELSRAIQSALMSLPEERRLTAILIDIQGYSYEDAARITNVNVGTVKSRLARARAGIRDRLRQAPELLPDRFRQDN